FEREHGYDLSGNETVQQRLKAVAQQIKHELTNRHKVKAKVTEYVPGTLTELDLEFTLTRDAFDRRCADIVDESLETCEEALSLAEMQKSSIDHLVMVGGTTRVPLVQREVRSFFDMDPVLDINPDEVVSIGAAIFGSTISERRQAPPPGGAESSGGGSPGGDPAQEETELLDHDELAADGGEDEFLEEDDDFLESEDEFGGDDAF
ncbi:MAG: Hsp70 family protein, partial [Bradymonadaceae bacterium]